MSKSTDLISFSNKNQKFVSNKMRINFVKSNHVTERIVFIYLIKWDATNARFQLLCFQFYCVLLCIFYRILQSGFGYNSFTEIIFFLYFVCMDDFFCSLCSLFWFLDRIWIGKQKNIFGKAKTKCSWVVM